MRKDSVLLSYYYDKLPKKALGGGIDAPLRNGNNKGMMNGFQLDQKKEGGWLKKYPGGGETAPWIQQAPNFNNTQNAKAPFKRPTLPDNTAAIEKQKYDALVKTIEDRKARIAASKAANDKGIFNMTAQDWAASAAAIPDELRGSIYPNIVDDSPLNPLQWIAGMASKAGQTIANYKQPNSTKDIAMALAEPVAGGFLNSQWGIPRLVEGVKSYLPVLNNTLSKAANVVKLNTPPESPTPDIRRFAVNGDPFHLEYFDHNTGKPVATTQIVGVAPSQNDAVEAIRPDWLKPKPPTPEIYPLRPDYTDLGNAYLDRAENFGKMKPGKEGLPSDIKYRSYRNVKPESEINWGNLDKDVLKEYYTIEQKSKANGTWLKNADGTDFKGTPEEFVKSQSNPPKQEYGGNINSVTKRNSNNWLDKFANGGGFLMPFPTGGSIVDYLEANGQDSSKANRAKLAKQFGIDNYNFQGNQNLELLKKMQAAQQPAPAMVGPGNAPVQSLNDVSQYNTGNDIPLVQNTVIHETPKQLSIQQPVENRDATQAQGYAPPLFANTAERDAYRKRLTELGKKITSSPNDEQYLAKLNGIRDASGKLMDWGSDENCINGVCGVNIAAGLKYNHPSYQDRYIGNRTFYDAVNNHQEDYYRVNGNFQVGDHVQFMDRSTDNKNHVIYRNGKPVLKPHHSALIYDVTTDDDGQKRYHFLNNHGQTQFVDDYSRTEKELKDYLNETNPTEGVTNKFAIIVNRPGYSLDKDILEKSRMPKDPKVAAALQAQKDLVYNETHNDAGYHYSLKPNVKPTEGMQKFIAYANNTDNINKLVKQLKVPKNIIHDELLNTFGELGTENKWENPTFIGGSYGLETPVERLGSVFNTGKNLSVGPGQIKMSQLEEEEKRAEKAGQKSLKDLFDIKSMQDLQDFDKVIPLMTALNIRNRQWIERQGSNINKYFNVPPVESANNLPGGAGRWTPYMYQGSMKANPVEPINPAYTGLMIGVDNYGTQNLGKWNPPLAANATSGKAFTDNSYAKKVFNNINNNLIRTIDATGVEGKEPVAMRDIVIKSTPKKVKKPEEQKFGGQTNNWLNKYNNVN